MRLALPIGKKPGNDGAPAESVERIVNGYVKAVPEGKEPTPVYGTPGLVLWASGLAGEIRGFIEVRDTLYAVAGTTFYEMAAGGIATSRGTIPGTDLVSMAADGINVVTVAGGEIYVWNGSTVAAVTDPDAPAASSVVWVDGFFVFGEADTQQWFISALADPTAYDALDFASAEWKPDFLVCPVVVRNTLYMMGTRSIEAQQNVGAAAFPFARLEDVFIDVGLIGRDAVVTTNDAMYWFAHDLTVRRMDGITATVISDDATKALMEAWADPSATVATAHVHGNRLFVVFRNPDGCVVFDQATERWHERRSDASDTWRVRHFAECYDLKLYGSATEGKIYYLDAEAYDEDGDPLPFEMVTPYAYAQGKRLTIDEVEVIAQMGVGSLTLDPQISLERTTDGETWSTRQYRRMGKTGQRNRRVTFGAQGSSRGAAFKIRITDPVQRAILGIYAEVDVEA